MNFDFKYIYIFIILILFLGCKESISSQNSDDTNANPPSRHIVLDDTTVQSLGRGGNIHVDINIGNKPKDAYILLSNYSKSKSSSINIEHSNKLAHNKVSKMIPVADSFKIASHAPRYIQEFNSKIKQLLVENNTTLSRQDKVLELDSKQKRDAIAASKVFYLDKDAASKTIATARKIVSNITTDRGKKTLNIWVSNDSFGANCPKATCVSQPMVDALANSFLKIGLNNDIYDWVTNIYGEEWNSAAGAKYSNIIENNDEITILLTDIDNDNSTDGGTVGFFWSKDNIKKSSISGSNERVMFYIDALLFASADGIWSIDDFWPKEIVSTLVHEFQHMIHFYQKTVMLSGDTTDTWLNEMLSETTEDLIATKIKYRGPRGVEYTDGSAGDFANLKGRYPKFNANNTLSLTSWSNSSADYSKVNAFGAYLIRNYGGAKLLHDIVHNVHVDEQAIIYAVRKSTGGSEKTFVDLQREWGIAVLLSDNENLENLPTYNTGDFTFSEYRRTRYQMGSINFFNYSPTPMLQTSVGTISKQANYFYKIGDGIRGKMSLDLRLGDNTEATLLLK